MSLPRNVLETAPAQGRSQILTLGEHPAFDSQLVCSLFCASPFSHHGTPVQIVQDQADQQGQTAGSGLPIVYEVTCMHVDLPSLHTGSQLCML